MPRRLHRCLLDDRISQPQSQPGNLLPTKLLEQVVLNQLEDTRYVRLFPNPDLSLAAGF